MWELLGHFDGLALLIGIGVLIASIGVMCFRRQMRRDALLGIAELGEDKGRRGL
ncbi:MAG: hypothetical protein ACRDG7_09980 [Candidatus Limnocylindria bacterium]